MHRKSLILMSGLILILALMIGCTKSNPIVFSWNYQGLHYVADSAYSPASVNPNVIISAYSGTNAVEITAGTRLAVGSYPLHNRTTTSYLFYYSVVQLLYSQSGTLNVTSNDNTKMSGNFNVTFTDGTTMSGSFTDMPIR